MKKIFGQFLLLGFLYCMGCSGIGEKNKSLPSSVMSHRYGFDASMTFCTDNIYPQTFEVFEATLMKNNFGFTVFESSIYNSEEVTNEEKSAVHKTGRGSVELYLRTENWVNPKTGESEIIPDYYADIWSKDGAAFFDVKAGTPKKKRFPNHGQELFDISKGKYGFDGLNKKPGAFEFKEFLPYFDAEKTALEKLRDNEPVTTLSYGNGKTGCAAILGHSRLVIGGRNSNADEYATSGVSSFYGNHNGRDLGNNPFLYQDDMNHSISRDLSVRPLANSFENMRMDKDRFPAILKANLKGVESTIRKGGFFSSFSHWQYYHGITSPYTEKDFRSEFIKRIEMIRMKVNSMNAKVYSESYEDIVSYYMARELVDKVEATETNGEVSLTVFVKNKLGVNRSLVKSPVSIAIDLSQTYLKGKEIIVKSERLVGIRKGTLDQYVLDLDLQKVDTSFTVVLDKTATPDYYNFAPPEIDSLSFRNNTCIVKTLQKSNVVLYYKPKKASLNSLRVLQRSNQNAITHEIDLTQNKYPIPINVLLKGNLYIGVITSQTKQSDLFEIN